jgi:ABC-type phosphate transport system substrate-binding protein
MKLSSVALSAAVAALVCLPAGTSAARASTVPTYATIDGSGSVWQAVPIDRWAQFTGTQGLVVNYNPDGNTNGRGDYMQGSQVDFAASDVPFRDGHDKLGRTAAEKSPYSYSYLPLVAGGIAIAYHLTVHGRPVTGVRLSATTLMEIFTGQITNWDDPRIARDNGRRLPDVRIIPVVRGDAAGSTFYFTDWLADRFPRQWNAFCARVTKGRVKAPCGNTEFYPVSGPGWHPQAEVGSNAVIDYLTSKAGNGAIGYDEYAYAHAGGAEVARIANPAGKYVLPTAGNVTEALTAASVNENPHSPYYLEENLAGAFASKNPASYPLSYYGYLIVPRSGGRVPPIFSTAAGISLSTFAIFAICSKGQAQQAAIGDATLPANLVAAGLAMVARIPGHVAVPSLRTCRR